MLQPFRNCSTLQATGIGLGALTGAGAAIFTIFLINKFNAQQAVGMMSDSDNAASVWVPLIMLTLGFALMGWALATAYTRPTVDNTAHLQSADYGTLP